MRQYDDCRNRYWGRHRKRADLGPATAAPARPGRLGAPSAAGMGTASATGMGTTSSAVRLHSVPSLLTVGQEGGDR